MDMSLGKVRKLVMDREAWCAVIHEATKSWTRLSDWTEPKYLTVVTTILKAEKATIHLIKKPKLSLNAFPEVT